MKNINSAPDQKKQKHLANQQQDNSKDKKSEATNIKLRRYVDSNFLHDYATRPNGIWNQLEEQKKSCEINLTVKIMSKDALRDLSVVHRNLDRLPHLLRSFYVQEIYAGGVISPSSEDYKIPKWPILIDQNGEKVQNNSFMLKFKARNKKVGNKYYPMISQKELRIPMKPKTDYRIEIRDQSWQIYQNNNLKSLASSRIEIQDEKYHQNLINNEKKQNEDMAAKLNGSLNDNLYLAVYKINQFTKNKEQHQKYRVKISLFGQRTYTNENSPQSTQQIVKYYQAQLQKINQKQPYKIFMYFKNLWYKKQKENQKEKEFKKEGGKEVRLMQQELGNCNFICSFLSILKKSIFVFNKTNVFYEMEANHACFFINFDGFIIPIQIDLDLPSAQNKDGLLIFKNCGIPILSEQSNYYSLMVALRALAIQKAIAAGLLDYQKMIRGNPSEAFNMLTNSYTQQFAWQQHYLPHFQKWMKQDLQKSQITNNHPKEWKEYSKDYHLSKDKSQPKVIRFIAVAFFKDSKEYLEKLFQGLLPPRQLKEFADNYVEHGYSFDGYYQCPEFKIIKLTEPRGQAYAKQFRDLWLKKHQKGMKMKQNQLFIPNLQPIHFQDGQFFLTLEQLRSLNKYRVYVCEHLTTLARKVQNSELFLYKSFKYKFLTTWLKPKDDCSNFYIRIKKDSQVIIGIHVERHRIDLKNKKDINYCQVGFMLQVKPNYLLRFYQKDQSSPISFAKYKHKLPRSKLPSDYKLIVCTNQDKGENAIISLSSSSPQNFIIPNADGYTGEKQPGFLAWQKNLLTFSNNKSFELIQILQTGTHRLQINLKFRSREQVELKNEDLKQLFQAFFHCVQHEDYQTISDDKKRKVYSQFDYQVGKGFKSPSQALVVLPCTMVLREFHAYLEGNYGVRLQMNRQKLKSHFSQSFAELKVDFIAMSYPENNQLPSQDLLGAS